MFLTRAIVLESMGKKGRMEEEHALVNTIYLCHLNFSAAGHQFRAL